ncbi:MAG TPA: ABC transporter substrate-binding protein [Gaiellaceae bacterium]|nr:ABC transporter substrate-binding protein [Gaiellaceae bacterium]
MRRTRWIGVVALAACAAVAVGVFAGAGAARPSASPIVIGWAHDSTGPMAPFDGPALAAAMIRVKQLNARGGVAGRQLVIKTCDTQGDKPSVSKACADKLIGQGANIIFTTCDVDLAAPAVQESINRGLLTVAPCIGTDQMGPSRFGPAGKLAFSFGNVAQDEGSAMAQFAWKKGWRKAALATDTVIVYFKNVVQAFAARWKQLGGKIVSQVTYQDPAFHGNNVQNAVSHLNDASADVIVTSTAGAYGALAPLITGLRTLGNDTPVLNSWAGDGTYWLPKSPPVTNYFFVTYADSFGQDPNAAVNKLAKQVHAATGGFVTGPAAIDGVASAIRRAHGSTNGSTLASIMQTFHNVPTLSGLVSFSPTLHSVFGRSYRVVEIENNKPRLVTTLRAKVVPKIS